MVPAKKQCSLAMMVPAKKQCSLAGQAVPPTVVLPFILQLNDRLSLGQHRVWKRMAVKWSGAAPGQRALDVCCGSGDLALLLAAAVGPTGSVTGLDFAAEMLEVSGQAQQQQQQQFSSPAYNRAHTCSNLHPCTQADTERT